MPNSSKQTNGKAPQSNNNVPQKTGRNMAIIAWIIGMILLTRFLGTWEENQINPNKELTSNVSDSSEIKVALERNRYGHYVFNGKINNYPATFMVDTGATSVVIPKDIADDMNLESYGQSNASTANGIITVYNTMLKTVSIGPITLYNVRASINPAMNKHDDILMGMSVLKQLELRQQDNTLTLIQNAR